MNLPLIIVFLVFVFFIIRIAFTLITASRVINAIYKYNIKCIHDHAIRETISYSKMTSYGYILIKFWIWDYKSWVDDSTWSKIKPYI